MKRERRASAVASVAGVSAALGGGLGWWLSSGWLFAAAVAAPSALAACVDVASRRLPNLLVMFAAWPTIGALVAESIDNGLVAATPPVLLGMAAMGLAPFVCHSVSPASMGFGDVKLSFVLGAALGTWDPALGMIALAIGSLAAMLQALIRRSRSVAFGPGLVLGFAVAVTFATSLAGLVGGSSSGWLRW